MVRTETLEQFYERHYSGKSLPANNAGQGHFNVFLRACSQKTPLSRRDFYKVTLVIGNGIMHYEDRQVVIDRPALVFTGPQVPSCWEPTSDIQSGWFCLFTQAFIENQDYKHTIQDFPLFKAGGNHVIFLDEKQLAFLSITMQQMMEEMDSDYRYKYDLLRSYLRILMHEALKIEPAPMQEKTTSAATRITTLFFELLERQFPIDSPDHALKLNTANDYAENLSVHTNHLNRSVKEITGKTTTQHITERVLKEAHALLKYTDWNIAQVANALGFEEPAYFTNFFKKHTGAAPGISRHNTAVATR